MLRIAVQSKGRLYDETMLLLEEAGIKLNRGKRILLLSAKGFPVEVLFLRDDDIPQSVANGVADIGIVGENEYVEKIHKPTSSSSKPKPNTRNNATALNTSRKPERATKRSAGRVT